MSYEPTVWQAGDTITSARLNKLEQGVAGGGGGGMVVHATATIPEGAGGPVINVTDATAGEIFEAMSGGSNVVMLMQLTTSDGTESDAIQIMCATINPTGGYEFIFVVGGRPLALEAATASDYPHFGDE